MVDTAVLCAYGSENGAGGFNSMTTTTIRIRGYHEDRFGHVNNARYLELLEDARWAHLEERGLDGAFFKAHGIFPVVVGLTVSYRRPASAGDTLHVTAEIASARSRKIVIAQTIRHAESDAVCVEAEVTAVFLDEATGRPVLLSSEILAAWPELSEARA